jgi:hypothetical protein
VGSPGRTRRSGKAHGRDLTGAAWHGHWPIEAHGPSPGVPPPRQLLPGKHVPCCQQLTLRAAWHTSGSPSVMRWLMPLFSRSSRPTSSGRATACLRAGMAAARCKRTLGTGS